MMNILIIDNQSLYREAVMTTVCAEFAGTKFFETDDIADLYSSDLQNRGINLVIVDLRLPGFVRLRHLAVAIKAFPGACVLAMDWVSNAVIADEVINLGAAGYFPKTGSRQDLINAVSTLVNGEIYRPPQAGRPEKAVMRNLKQDTLRKALEQLSSRQKQIVELLMQGKRIKEISAEIGLSERATKYHLSSLRDKVGISGRMQLVIQLLALRVSST